MFPTWFTTNAGLGTIYPAVVLLILVLFFRYYIVISKPLTGTVEWIYRTISDKRWNLLREPYPVEKGDILPICVIVVVFAFLSLGNILAPVHSWPNTTIIADGLLYQRGSLIYIHQAWVGSPLGDFLKSFSQDLFGAPALGRQIIAAGFGVFLPVVTYIFIKILFGKTSVAVCGTLLLGFDFMRFVETSFFSPGIAAAVCIVLSYLFMYQFMTIDKDMPFKKCVLPLAFSGFFFGLAFSFVWISFFGGLGLFALFIIRLAALRGYYRIKYPQGGVFGSYLAKVLLISFVFFVFIPAVIQILGHIAVYRNVVSFGDIFGILADIIAAQRGNLSGLIEPFNYFTQHHALSMSSLRQMILNLRPIVLHDSFYGDGRSMVLLFGNPMVWWGGFFAMGAMIYRVIKRKDIRALVILAGYLSTVIPWIVFSSAQPINQYFLSVPFLVLALSHVFNTIISRGLRRSKQAVYLFTGATGAVFLKFYPALTGIYMQQWFFRDFLVWLPGRWPF